MRLIESLTSRLDLADTDIGTLSNELWGRIGALSNDLDGRIGALSNNLDALSNSLVIWKATADQTITTLQVLDLMFNDDLRN